MKSAVIIFSCSLRVICGLLLGTLLLLSGGHAWAMREGCVEEHPAPGGDGVEAVRAHPRHEVSDSTKKAQEPSWRKVVVTRREKEVAGMRRVDDYDVTLTASGKGWRHAKTDELERGAITQLRQKAADAQATHLLVREVKFITAYGEPSSVQVVATSYQKRQQ